MKELELIDRYFEFLDKRQRLQLESFLKLLIEWNHKINLVSRADIGQLVEHHLLPSLAIAKCCQFAPGAKILDVGTGGGFPGIPLAIVFPESQFLLIDSIGKKIKAVEAIAKALELKNVRTQQIRVELLKESFDFITGRAVTQLVTFIHWVKDKVRSGAQSSLPNGILYLKGGDISEEIQELGVKPTKVFPLELFFDNQFCQDKCLIYFDKKSLSTISKDNNNGHKK